MGLPDNSDGRFDGLGELSLTVGAIRDTAGQQLLADERCLSANDLMGRSPNHKPETSSSHSQNEAWVWKYLRLKPDTAIDDIAAIQGQIAFTIPTRVRRFAVPLRAGETVEAAGLRFYLRRAGNDSITYQISGDRDKLLEVRALNQTGQVLRKGWTMQSGDDGPITQKFEGEPAAVELYIAEQRVSHRTEFLVAGLFKPVSKAADNAPKWFAPARIDASQWQDYAGLDMDQLAIDPKRDWAMWGSDIHAIAEADWPAMRMFITHKPQQWDNNPRAHLYLPMLADLPGVLSALSYRIDQPAVADGATKRFVRISYPYYSNSGEIVSKRKLQDRPIAAVNFPLATGLQPDQRLTRLKGALTVRLPLQTRSTRLDLSTLWQGRSVDGVRVTLTEVSRGMFPGYGLKIEGAIDKLVNLHGLTANGDRIQAAPINFQDNGYWTMTLPFNDGMKQLELITATQQQQFEFPFDTLPSYPEP